jgi:putative toxin-antitoxin system antitoxin component (TIGR02293 family)
MPTTSFAPFNPPKSVYTARPPGAVLLKLNVANLHELEDALNSGLPIESVETLMNQCGIELTTAAALLGMGYSTLKTYRRNRMRLTPEQSARAYRVARIYERAVAVIGSEVDARAWLAEPVLALGNRTPLAAMTSDLGSERVLHILERLDDGVYS